MDKVEINKMNTDKMKSFFKYLGKHHIFIQYGYPNGFGIIPYSDIFKIINNRVEYLVEHYGVSKKRFIKWENFIQGSKGCTYIKNNGERCKNCSSGDAMYPSQFKPGLTDRCYLHQNFDYREEKDE